MRCLDGITTCSEHMEILDDTYKLPNHYFAKLQSWKENIQGPEMKKKLKIRTVNWRADTDCLEVFITLNTGA